jgi:hypothetical protein
MLENKTLHPRRKISFYAGSLVVVVGLCFFASRGLASPDAMKTSATPALDEDGVQMLLPSAAVGSSLRLGKLNPNTHAQFAFDYRAVAVAADSQQSGGIPYWNLPSSELTYSSNGAKGYTGRLHLYASGGKQNYNWKTQKGYLSSPLDVKNQEFTLYLRVHEVLTPHVAQASLKIRGGGHHAYDPHAGSCVMMTLGAEQHQIATRFGKELSHPLYDYVPLKAAFDATLKDNVWVGLKLLSWSDPQDPLRVINQLYADTTPFDAHGRPQNRWRLLSEYVDVEGKSTGKYSKLVDWGGWMTTLRVDGYRSIDFAYPSVREIVPMAVP